MGYPVPQQLGRVTNVPRHLSGIIDDRVPASPALHGLQPRLDACVAIADQDLDAIAKQPRCTAAAIEQRDTVALLQRMFDLQRPEEAGTARG